MADEAKPANVIEALARITEEMPAIQKSQSATGLKYKFRSIEQFTGHASVLFAKYGVVIAPLGQTIEYVEVDTKGGGSMTEARTRHEWAIYGPAGIADVIHAATFGEARDTADKAANKAHTAAYKYLLMTLLTISDDKEDPEFERLGDSAGSGEAGYEETDEERAAAERFQTILAEAVTGRETFGDEWASVIREAAATRGHESVNAWIRSDPDDAETFIVQHKLRGQMALAQPTPEEEPTKPKRTRAKAGSAVVGTDEVQQAVVTAEEGLANAAAAFPSASYEEELELD